MLEIQPADFLWILLFMGWIGSLATYTGQNETKTFIKVLGIGLLLSGILLVGIAIGKR